MRLDYLAKLLSSISVLLLLAFPLRAQTLLRLAAAYNGSNTPWLNSGSLSECDRQTADLANGSLRSSAIPLNSGKVCVSDGGDSLSSASDQRAASSATGQMSERATDPPNENGTSSAVIAQHHQRSDRNLDIYYRNRTEFSLDVGWHPKNIPFIYDFAVGDTYNMTPLKYTLVPIVASLRWHVTNVGWRWIFRGNMDFTFSGSITPIPRGPETHYYSLDFGIRRNFVYRNWKVVPYWEQRGGAGIINAKEPLGVLWAQGQNLTFTYSMGAGVRYSINSKYSFSGGMNYMHISNAYLSQPQFYNYGINVYGPMFGLNVRLGKPRHHDSE
jgi:Lipid A 3-O-deacylase (PagL)